MGRGATSALAALVLCFLAPPPAGATGAKSGYELTRPSLELFFFAEASNGYSLFVRGQRPDRVEVHLAAPVAADARQDHVGAAPPVHG